MAQSKSSVDAPAKTSKGRAGWGRNPVAIIATVALFAVVGLALVLLAFSTADRGPGASGAGGQTSAGPKAAAMSDAPEPQPKQPSATDVARSSTPIPTPTVPRAAGATQPSRDTPDATRERSASARQPTTVGTTSVTGAISNPGQ
jgi:hypothetical protein